MGAFDGLMAGQVQEGYWGDHTASIDWCETNYASTRFIAEFINTLSNIPFIALGAYGAYKMRKCGAPLRYAATMAGLAGIGLGSAGFHTTLKWEWQMMDELPMIYVIMHSTYLVFDTSPGFEMGWSWLGLLAVFAFDAFITVSYFYFNNPVYHQLTFAAIQILSTVRVTNLILSLPPSSVHPARGIVFRLFYTGLAIFAAGFAIWNVDNIFCNQLKAMKEVLLAQGGIVAKSAWALEGHAWWHLATGYGSYLVITGATYLCLIKKMGISEYIIEGTFLPHIEKAVANESSPAPDVKTAVANGTVKVTKADEMRSTS